MLLTSQHARQTSVMCLDDLQIHLLRYFWCVKNELGLIFCRVAVNIAILRKFIHAIKPRQ